ncbi:DUF6362 family protein [Ralstonia sp.]|uniref:DUF6362 family protein n=1 Tax=Ralstonia sp. TaxID=54061 RepID=UPI0031D6CF06
MADWTIEDVATRLAEAASTSRRLPRERGQGYFSMWPAFMRAQWEAFATEGRPAYRPVPPSPAAIERMLEAMRWVQWLTVEQRHLVWMRAVDEEWEDIGKRFGCCRSTAWRRWQRSLTILVTHLNGTSDAVPRVALR